MKALFVEGGPLNGQILDLPDGAQEWHVAQPVSLRPFVFASSMPASTSAQPRGRYLRYEGIEQRNWRRNVEPIAVPFVWQGWT